MSSYVSCFQLSHRQAAENCGAAVEVHGPIPQADLLAGLGIGVRLEALLKNARGSGAADALRSGYARLVQNVNCRTRSRRVRLKALLNIAHACGGGSNAAQRQLQICDPTCLLQQRR